MVRRDAAGARPRHLLQGPGRHRRPPPRHDARAAQVLHNRGDCIGPRRRGGAGHPRRPADRRPPVPVADKLLPGDGITAQAARQGLVRPRHLAFRGDVRRPRVGAGDAAAGEAWRAAHRPAREKSRRPLPVDCRREVARGASGLGRHRHRGLRRRGCRARGSAHDALADAGGPRPRLHPPDHFPLPVGLPDVGGGAESFRVGRAGALLHASAAGGAGRAGRRRRALRSLMAAAGSDLLSRGRDALPARHAARPPRPLVRDRAGAQVGAGGAHGRRQVVHLERPLPTRRD
mmetsp:Transcript_6005/g.18007  ORF Transcript_6005/g.18007 Transcript_6005/m.18007 type:complete len:289 (-) Transcript_6005:711-1577(-)